ncbi:hypothetical protein [Streptacidiphilus sp. MAP5-3]|uniref:hypothetical protein n=1 Tax=unclassified Streptacidiphilus TaxID=2643834 RepID=UPI0035162397
MRKIQAGLGGALAAALTVVAIPAAHAATPAYVGTVNTYVNGMPATVERGTTVDLTIWYRESSAYNVIPFGSALSLAADDLRQPGYRGVTVSVQDPVTGKWNVVRSAAGSNDGYYFSGYSQPKVLHPAYFAHLNIRISFSKAAYAGRWEASMDATTAYGVFNARGQAVSGYMRLENRAVDFTVK